MLQAAERETEIVSLRETGLDLIHKVLRKGEPLLVRRPDDVLAWEAEQMTGYAFFSARRRDILAQYLREQLRMPGKPNRKSVANV